MKPEAEGVQTSGLSGGTWPHQCAARTHALGIGTPVSHPLPLCGSAGFRLTGHIRALFGLEVGEASNALLSSPRWFSQAAKT